MAFTFGTFVILVITFAIVAANVLILLVLFRTDMITCVNRYFFISMTLADLCIGVFVTPFSFWTSMFDRWIYGDKFCHLEAYLAAIFWIGSVYSMTWVSIDHYVAIRKPERYESVMSRTRCVCWLVFMWLVAFSFCCPPLFGVSRARYYPEAYICIIDWSLQKAYFITSGLIVIIPPIIALSVVHLYLLTGKYQQKKAIYEKCTESNPRPELYVMNSLVSLVFVISWFPWCMAQLHEVLHGTETQPSDHPAMHFIFMWFAVANSLWKFVVYCIFDHDFRVGLRILKSKVSCTWSR